MHNEFEKLWGELVEIAVNFAITRLVNLWSILRNYHFKILMNLGACYIWHFEQELQH
jgi:hypothetical protein